MEGILTPTVLENHSIANDPFCHYYIPRLCRICLSIELVGKPSLCLRDFARNLSVEEGRPLYVIYAPKMAGVNRHECVDEWKGWLIAHSKECGFAFVKDVEAHRPIQTDLAKSKKPGRTKPVRRRTPLRRDNLDVWPCVSGNDTPAFENFAHFLKLYLFRGGDIGAVSFFGLPAVSRRNRYIPEFGR